MNVVAGQVQQYAVTLTGQVVGAELSVQVKFPFAAGQSAQTKTFKYIVGDNCGAVNTDATDATLSDLKLDNVSLTGFVSGKLNYSVVLPKGTTIIPQITAVTKANSKATHTITQSPTIPGDAAVVVVSENTNTTKTYKVSFSLDASTACEGTSKEAAVGEFSQGFNYKFETLQNGTDVKVTFTLLDTDKAGLSGVQLFQSPSTNTNMTAVAGQVQVFTLTLTGQVTGENLSLAARFPFAAGGVALTKNFIYKVGDNCTTLGISDFKVANIRMYPNPVSNELTIEAKNTIQKVAVYNLLGQEILSTSPKANAAKIQTSSLSKGVYIITTTVDDVVSSSKFIKQ
jgi:hypothetical protein